MAEKVICDITEAAPVTKVAAQMVRDRFDLRSIPRLAWEWGRPRPDIMFHMVMAKATADAMGHWLSGLRPADAELLAALKEAEKASGVRRLTQTPVANYSAHGGMVWYSHPLVGLHELGHIACGHSGVQVKALQSGKNPLKNIRLHEQQANDWGRAFVPQSWMAEWNEQVRLNQTHYFFFANALKSPFFDTQLLISEVSADALWGVEGEPGWLLDLVRRLKAEGGEVCESFAEKITEYCILRSFADQSILFLQIYERMKGKKVFGIDSFIDALDPPLKEVPPPILDSVLDALLAQTVREVGIFSDEIEWYANLEKKRGNRSRWEIFRRLLAEKRKAEKAEHKNQ